MLMSPMSARFAPLFAKLGARLHLAASTKKARCYLIEHLSSDVEIRRYESRIAAEVAITAKNAISGEDEAFRILAGYVFGANQVRTKLSVLTPVEVTGRYVTAQAATTSIEVVRMRFFLESRSLETAPRPLDPRIRVLAVGEQRIGVLRFRSGRDPRVLPGFERKLITALTGAGWKAVGEPAVFLYGPQFLSRLPHQTELGVAVGPRSV
jgi:hypothetical protein